MVVLALAGTVLGVTAQPGASAGGGPGVAAGAGSGWIPDVAVAGDPDSAYNPAIATAPNGDVYAAWVSVVGGNGAIEFGRSTDGGLTWLPPSQVTGRTENAEWPALAVDPDSGRTFAAYYVPASRTLMVAWSDDRVTWTPVRVYDCALGGPFAACSRPTLAVEYANGAANRVYLAVEAQTGGSSNFDVLVFTSGDHGMSWTQALNEGQFLPGAFVDPAIAVQRGKDGINRVIVVYREGGTIPTATNGMVVWSEDHGATWHTPARWTMEAGLPPAIAAARDGSSVLVTTGAGLGPDVAWFASFDPTDLSTVSEAGTWVGFGYATHLAVDGGGSPDATIGGSYHVLATARPGVRYLRVAVDLSSVGPVQTVTEDSAAFTGADRDFGVTTQLRGGSWWAAVVWSGFRNGVDLVKYSTPGARLSLETSPPGLAVTVDGTDQVAPYASLFVAGTAVAVDAPSPQVTQTGARVAFAAWSDGGPRAHAVPVATTDETITASFAGEVPMTIYSTPPGLAVTFHWETQTTPATFWVLPGTYLAVVPSPQPGGAGTRYAFATWSDGGAVAHEVVVSGPSVLFVDFTTQYRLTVTTPHGIAAGEGWYDRGTLATFSVPPDVEETGAVWAFAGWTGDSAAGTPQATILMDGPKTVTAEWRLASRSGGIPGAGVFLLPLAAVFLLLLVALAWRRRKRPYGSGPSTRAPPPA